ncbi:DNA-3-methyladenine glycosylase I [Flavobacteriales bacterium]|nr:DNA-3-methyladenine glycosylase I [Flavobacteriales bacterium]
MSLNRCDWVSDDPLYIAYHDKEWGVPLHDEQRLFEFLILETFQAGLSWITVLRKRENFRRAFDQFDYKKIAKYDEPKIRELLQNTGIIRNKLKVKAAISNAQAFIEVQEEFDSFDKYIWRFVNDKPLQNNFKMVRDIPAKTEIAEVLSEDLKKWGFKFVGPTVVYAHMQATGMVNNHTIDCFRFKEVQQKL